MNKLNKWYLALLLSPLFAGGQIITPIIKANFGVDADLRCNFFNGLVQSGNDDWFRLPGSVGTGQFVIDTAGAAALLTGYTTNPNSRKLPFYKQMRFPPYTVVNNRLLVDAVFVRDYHGDDSTIFAAGSNKNGMSPASWSCPVSQSIPDKNEILDIMLHVRRAGPNLTDSLWMMGGISIENTTGNRYFDFEMYQTDIYYDRATRRFYNYGPDAGHTSWQFDASGNMTAPGDIILTAEYSSSSLTAIEARIWVNSNDLLITPAAFDWTGSFDGDGSGAVFGYAGIRPKTAGAFYTGLQSVSNTWTGPFQLVLGDNSIVTNYAARQYMEYSVNLSKLGLDQARIFGGDDCVMPFRRIIVKTRASTSFTSELKDFVAPFDFFLAPRAEIETTTPIICDTGSVSFIYVSNPIPTSIYQWSTLNGRIVGPTTGPSITVDTPGVYIVQQYLQAACSLYATDTITIASFGSCSVLSRNLLSFNSLLNGRMVQLQWKVLENQLVKDFELERSTNGVDFTPLYQLPADASKSGIAVYGFTDDLNGVVTDNIYYRLTVNQTGNKIIRSNIIRHDLLEADRQRMRISPNPVQSSAQLQINLPVSGKATICVYDQLGKIVSTMNVVVQKGSNTIELDMLKAKPDGIYQVRMMVGSKVFTEKILLDK
ncbi:MAG: T9SS type A sorting domain-containing protein [Chitinophagaceae bacterium]|nr:T9SS type A sorting domain-containing protein [Chitinophagaceae bacterium]